MTSELNKAGLGAAAWPLAGYAPGSYMCLCATCGEQFMGDKRAVQCLPCAASGVNARITALQAEMTEARLQQKAWADKWDYAEASLAAARQQIDALTEALRGVVTVRDQTSFAAARAVLKGGSNG